MVTGCLTFRVGSALAFYSCHRKPVLYFVMIMAMVMVLLILISLVKNIFDVH